MIKISSALLLGLFVAVFVVWLIETGVFAPLDAWWFTGVMELVASRRVPNWVDWSLICLVAFGGTLFSRHVQLPLPTLFFCFAVVAEIVFGTWVASLYGWEWSPFPPIVALFVGMMLVSLMAAGGPARRRKSVGESFADRISAETGRELVKKGGAEWLMKGPCEVGVVVCRAWNVGPLAEALAPETFREALGQVLGRAYELARLRGAMVEWKGAAGFEAVFGLVSLKSGSQQAVDFLLELNREAKEWNAECARANGMMIDLRIGAESGLVMFVREGKRGALRAAGDVLIDAERFCHANTVYNSMIALGAGMYNQVSEHVEVRPLDFVEPSGGGPKSELYELICASGELDANQASRRDAYWRGVILFREHRYVEAIAAFEEASVPGAGDGPLSWYLSKAIRAEASVVEPLSAPGRIGLG